MVGSCWQAQIHGSGPLHPLCICFLAGAQGLEIFLLKFVKIKHYAACEMLHT